MAWKGEVRPDDWIRLDDDPRLHPAAKVRDLKFPPDVLAEHAARPSTRSPNAVVAADGAYSAIEAPTVVDVPTKPVAPAEVASQSPGAEGPLPARSPARAKPSSLAEEAARGPAADQLVQPSRNRRGIDVPAAKIPDSVATDPSASRSIETPPVLRSDVDP